MEFAGELTHLDLVEGNFARGIRRTGALSVDAGGRKERERIGEGMELGGIQRLNLTRLGTGSRCGSSE